MRTLRAFAPALIWAALVWLIGGMEGVPSGGMITRFDKVAHFTMYGVLGWLCGRGWNTVGGPIIGVALVSLALLLGAGDEWRQGQLPTRSADFSDWVADAAGVITGFFLAVLRARQRLRT